MKITIDTDILSKHQLTLGEYLLLLLGYFDIHSKESLNKLIFKSLGESDWREPATLVLPDNTKELVARIITESSPKLNKSPIKDFDALAIKLQAIYPNGIKGGTTYPWRGTVEEIAQKLRVLVVQHDFIYTEEEAIQATKQYVDSFKDDTTCMKLLKYFLLRTKDKEISSDFMTIIENNRDENNNR